MLGDTIVGNKDEVLYLINLLQWERDKYTEKNKKINMISLDSDSKIKNIKQGNVTGKNWC